MEEQTQDSPPAARQAPPRRRARPTALPDEPVVQKANESIAIRPKKGRLTLLSRRIYNALLYHAQQQGVDERQYTIPLSILVGDAHFQSRNVALLKEYIREMQTTLIEWNSVGGGEQRWTSTQLLGAVEIAERGAGHPTVITWTYPDRVRERLLKPSRYTKVLLEVGAQMRSYASAVLFELGLQYFTSPSRLTMREDIYWWASVLTGRSDIEKVDYRYFKRDVLRPALAELDALQGDFSLELIEHKAGRRIVDLQFMVHRKNQAALEVTEDRNPFDLVLVERLRKLGMKDEDAERLYSKTDEGLLRATVDHVEQRMRNTALPPLGSPAAYLRDALKKGYATSVADSAGDEHAEPPKPEPKRLPTKASLQTVRDEWDKAQARAAEAGFRELGEGARAEIEQAFESSELGRLLGPIASAWRRDRAASKIAGPVFFRWLAKRGRATEPSEGDLLSFALERGMITIGS